MTAGLAAMVAPLGVLASAELLTGGMFATTYRVTLVDGTRVVVKTAPTDTERLLSHEHDLLRTEAMVYGLGRPALLMPRVLLTDWSLSILPADTVVVTHLPGSPLDAVELTDDQRARTMRDLGAVMASLHAVGGWPAFGYPSTASLQAATWPQAFALLVETLLADAARWSVPVPADRVHNALARHASALADVTRPSLVHTDLWAGNLFVDPASGALVGVIDPERALWGDPLLELVGIDPFGRSRASEALLAGYAGAGGVLDVDSPSAITRLELYRLWMALVMTVEITPRAYEGDWVPAHEAAVAASLSAALDALA